MQARRERRRESQGKADVSENHRRHGVRVPVVGVDILVGRVARDVPELRALVCGRDDARRVRTKGARPDRGLVCPQHAGARQIAVLLKSNGPDLASLVGAARRQDGPVRREVDVHHGIQVRLDGLLRREEVAAALVGVDADDAPPVRAREDLSPRGAADRTDADVALERDRRCEGVPGLAQIVRKQATLLISRDEERRIPPVARDRERVEGRVVDDAASLLPPAGVEEQKASVLAHAGDGRVALEKAASCDVGEVSVEGGDWVPPGRAEVINGRGGEPGCKQDFPVRAEGQPVGDLSEVQRAERTFRGRPPELDRPVVAPRGNDDLFHFLTRSVSEGRSLEAAWPTAGAQALRRCACGAPGAAED